MGFTTKNRMGFFLVFFPEEQEKKLTSSSSAKFTTINTLLRRTNSAHILTTAQSTISICAVLVFITFLLFTLSTFEPNSHENFKNSENSNNFISRRHLFSRNSELSVVKSRNSYALNGMGNLYYRGTKAMSDLIVCHLGENVSGTELRFFLRILHRSALTSRSDVVFIFPNLHSSSFKSIIRQETDSFSKLVESTRSPLNTTESTRSGDGRLLSFNATQFYKSTKKEKEWAEPIWGRRNQAQANFSEGNSTESTRLSVGSVLSFEVDELDPENSLSGFMEHIPMTLRRWACYPMLLGRFRRNFKNILLLDMKDMFIVSDPLTRVRTRSPESVYLIQTKHNKKDKKDSINVNPGIIMGGARGVRRLSNAVLTQIARAAMQQHPKKKNPITESGILSQLVSNSNLLKNVNFVLSSESVPELMSWVNSGLGVSVGNFTVVKRGNNSNSLDFQKVVMKHLCSFSVDSSVYSSEC